MQKLADFLDRVVPPETPALVVRRAALEANLAAMQSRCDAAGVALRAHGKMHKCSALGRLQVARGAVGLCCQTVGEAEAFATAGIADLLVTAPPPPLFASRLAALAARGVTISTVADDPVLIDALAASAAQAGTRLRVAVDVDLGLHRTGCAPDDAVALAQRIAAEPSLMFDGVQGYLGHLQHLADLPARAAANARASGRLAGLVADLRSAGLPPLRVTGGGTGTFALDLAGGVFTELQAGSYAFMDVDYDAAGSPDGESWPFQPALMLAASVVSARQKSHVTVDAGLKALAVDGPPAKVIAGAAPGSRWTPMGDEHGAILHPATLARLAAAEPGPLGRDAAMAAIDADASVPWPADAPGVGAVVWLQPGHCDPTVNLHGTLWVADEDGRLERWEVDARR
jgi:D-serine deaminase-like pyridoxal phosphate-dependent protein